MKRLLSICAIVAGSLPLSGEVLSLQEQIDAAEANAVITVQPGEYGPIVIDKPVVLIGLDRPSIRGAQESHVVTIEADGVRMEGFRVSGSGINLSKDHAGIFVTGQGVVLQDNVIEDSLHGIYLKKASGARLSGNTIRGKTQKIVPIEDVMQKGFVPLSAEMCAVRLDINQRGNGIHLWNSSDNVVENNVIESTRDGIYFSFSHTTMVSGNTVRNVRYGLHYMYSDHNTFEGNYFEQNAAGAAIMYSEGLFVRNNHFTNNRGHRAYGLLVQSVDSTVFMGNEIKENTVGIYLENSNANTFRSNRVEENYVGVRLTASSMDNAFSRNVFGRNLHSVETDSASGQNGWAIDGVGNRWIASTPVDLNGDGVGELPHRETDLLGGFRRSFPLAGLLSESPALKLISFVQERLAIPGIPAIEDTHPLATQTLSAE